MTIDITKEANMEQQETYRATKFVVEVTTERGVYQYPATRLYSLSEIKKSASTYFGKFAELRGQRVLKRQFKMILTKA